MLELFHDQIQEAVAFIRREWKARRTPASSSAPAWAAWSRTSRSKPRSTTRRFRTSRARPPRATRPAGLRQAGRPAGRGDGRPVPHVRGLSAQADHAAGARDEGAGRRAARRQQRLRRHEPAVRPRRHHGHRGPHQPDGRQPADRHQRRPPRPAVPRHVRSPTTTS